jgi:hypothetical protein
MVLLANKQLFAWKNEPERERGGGGGIIDFRNQVRQSPRNSKRVIAKPRQVCTQSIIFHFKNIFSYIEEKKEKKKPSLFNDMFRRWVYQHHFFNHGESHPCMPHHLSTYMGSSTPLF